MAAKRDVKYSPALTGSNLGFPMRPGSGVTSVSLSGSTKKAIDCRALDLEEASVGILTLKHLKE